MSGDALAQAYFDKVRVRLSVLDFLFEKEAWSDVVREAQECVELCLKAQLRLVGIDPPKVHDVSRSLRECSSRLPAMMRQNIDQVCAISFRLRRDRELSFYGDADVIPTETYRREDAEQAIQDARWIFSLVQSQG